VNIQFIIAGVIAAASFGGAWSIQEWRYGAKEADRDRQNYETVLESQRLAFRAQTAMDKRFIDAQNAATLRNRVLRDDVDRLRISISGLSHDSAEALRRADTTHNACRDVANTQNDILNQCVGKYRAVAEDADRAISDRQTLIDAWPK